MTYRSKIVCNNCGHEEESPESGGVPPGWAELRITPARAERKARRQHICSKCAQSLLPHKLWRDAL